MAFASGLYAGRMILPPVVTSSRRCAIQPTIRAVANSNPDETTVENIMRQGISLTAKFPVIISHAYQAKRRYFDGASMFLHVPDPERSTAENILHLIRPDGKYTDDEAKLLDRCLILHA